ncbi:MAG: DUF86 domain-containing protein [Candidatus Adiutrix sp.]|jgi:uncharacterized protein with HEPN domain|nr:DUF86 domain-containing protein [Candidatus Adiutrix sp.]
MAVKDAALVTKIIAHIDRIQSYAGDMGKDGFLADSKLLEACVFNLLQMGELACRLTDEFRNTHPEIPWTKIRGLRHKIVHDYEGVDLEIIWDIVNNDLAHLRRQLAGLTLL